MKLFEHSIERKKKHYYNNKIYLQCMFMRSASSTCTLYMYISLVDMYFYRYNNTIINRAYSKITTDKKYNEKNHCQFSKHLSWKNLLFSRNLRPLGWADCRASDACKERSIILKDMLKDPTQARMLRFVCLSHLAW